MTLNTSLMLVLLSAFTYVVGFEVNQYFFSHFEAYYCAHLIFIPSGIRLIFVLVLAEYGAIGIILGSLFCDWNYYYQGDWMDIIPKSLISGLAPLLARQLSIHFLNLNPNLQGLSASILLRLSIVFAVISACFHQLWFMLNHHTSNFINSVMIMGLGDWLGSALVLALVSMLITVYRNFYPRNLY
jgi:hypothetical protein